MSDKNIDKEKELLEQLEELKKENIKLSTELEETIKELNEKDIANRMLKSELETWKKIAEKLAGYGFNCYYGSPLKFDSPEELIEIARKETEDEELARKEVLKDE